MHLICHHVLKASEKNLKKLKRLWINGSCDGSLDVIIPRVGRFLCGLWVETPKPPGHHIGLSLGHAAWTCNDRCISRLRLVQHLIAYIWHTMNIQVLAGVVVAACIMASWPWWFPGHQRSTETEQCIRICRRLQDINDIGFNRVQSYFDALSRCWI